jgi:hypothetical protein
MDPYRHGRCADCGEAEKELVNCAQCAIMHCPRCSAAGLCQACLRRALDATSWVLKLAGGARLRGRHGAWLAAGARLAAVAALGALVIMTASIREQTAPPAALSFHLLEPPHQAAVPPIAQAASPPYVPAMRPAPFGALEQPRPRRSLDSIKATLESATTPWPASLLSSLGTGDRSPQALLARARSLRQAGFDLTIVSIEMSPEAVRAALAEGLQTGALLPITLHGKPVGVALYGHGEGSLPRLAGLENGDIVTSINGLPLTSAEQAIAAYGQNEGLRAAVLEVLRRGRRMVVKVSWA